MNVLGFDEETCSNYHGYLTHKKNANDENGAMRYNG